MTVEGAQTLERGIRLLNLLAQSDGGLTVTQIARELGVGRTIVYRLVVSLERNSMIRRDDAGKYYVGLGVLAVAGDLFRQVQSVAQPVIERLARRTTATSMVVTADKTHVVVLAVAEPVDAELYLGARVGARTPIERSAAGQALLARRRGANSQDQFLVFTPGTADSAQSAAAVVPVGAGLELAVQVLLTGAPKPAVRPAVLTAAAEITGAFG